MADPAEDQPPAPWPDGTGVDLGRLDECSVVTSPAAIRVMERAAGPLFEEHGRTYAMAVAVALPGDTCPDVGS